MNELSQLLSLSDEEKDRRGLVYTPAEISKQPETWFSTFEWFCKKQPELREFLAGSGISGKSLPDSDLTVYLVGAGSSDYIGRVLSFLLRRAWNCDVIAVPSTDLLTHMDALVVPGRKYLWISFSRSGDSAEGVAVLAKAIERHGNVRHLVVSCNRESRMIRENSGNPRVLTMALPESVNDRGLAMTSSFSNMVVYGHCLANVSEPAAYERVITKLCAAGKDFLPKAADCAATLAKVEFSRACFVGSGALRGVAKESGLKVLELTAGRTQTLSESVLGLRHGPMAALDAESLFVCFLSGDPRAQKYEQDLLREIGTKKLAKERVVVSGSATSRDSFAERHIAPLVGEGISDEYRGPVDIMFGQLLGLFCSIHWNLMPDRPSPDGVISRVVQNVSIH